MRASFAAWRAAHFPAIGQGEIEVVGVSDIYANFGGGMQDPAALRHFLVNLPTAG